MEVEEAEVVMDVVVVEDVEATGGLEDDLLSPTKYNNMSQSSPGWCVIRSSKYCYHH